MGFKFLNGKPLFRNSKPSLCCCPDEDCSYVIIARIRGGSIFGQVDGAGPVYSSYNTNSPGAPDNTLSFGAGGAGESLSGQFYGSHTIRLWATTLDENDIDINDITVENLLDGDICINGVTYTTNTTLPELIEIVEDAGYPSDQSGLSNGVVLTITCGACPP